MFLVQIPDDSPYKAAYNAIWEQACHEVIENGNSEDPIGHIAFSHSQKGYGVRFPLEEMEHNSKSYL